MAASDTLLPDLVRCVTRAFYDDIHELLVNAIILKGEIRDEDLASLLQLQKKQVRGALAELAKDHILKSEQRSVAVSEMHNRKTTHMFWWIDYPSIIDMVKLRLRRMMDKLSKETTTKATVQFYICPNDQRQYSGLEVLSMGLMDDNGLFYCEDCHTELVSEERASQADNVAPQVLFNQQIKLMVQMLRKTDGLVITKAGDAYGRTDDGDFVAVAASASRTARGTAVPTVLKQGSGATTATVKSEYLPAAVLKPVVELVDAPPAEGGTTTTSTAASTTTSTTVSTSAAPADAASGSGAGGAASATATTTSAGAMSAAATAVSSGDGAKNSAALPWMAASQPIVGAADADAAGELGAAEDVAAANAADAPGDDGVDQEYRDKMLQHYARMATASDSAAGTAGSVAEAGQDDGGDAEEAAAGAMVSVAGEMVPLAEVTEAHRERMTAEEYEAYFELAHGDDDDDDEDVDDLY